jgi:hypothetical protein
MAAAARTLPFAIGGVTIVIATLLVTWPSSTYLPVPSLWGWVMGIAGALMLVSAMAPGIRTMRALAAGLVAASYVARGVAVGAGALWRDLPASARASGIAVSFLAMETAALILVVWARIVTPEGEAWASSQPPARTPSPSSESSPDSPPS